MLPDSVLYVANKGCIPYGLLKVLELNPNWLLDAEDFDGKVWGCDDDGVIGMFVGLIVIFPVDGLYAKSDSKFKVSRICC